MMRFTKIGLAAGLFGAASLAWGFDLNDTFNSLKAATEKKDAAQVKTLAPQAAKEARAIQAQADATADVKEFAKGAEEYSEYALSMVAAQSADAQATIDLTDLLLEQNGKSKHVDTATPAYLAALNKQGAAKASAGAQKVLAGRPENEDAMYQLTIGNPATGGPSATRLLALLRSKAKPEGISDADWQKKKDVMMGGAYYVAGLNAGSRQAWADCDRNLKAAEPLLKGNSQMLGITYFYLGLANYQMGKLTQDRTKIQAGLKYSQQSAAIPGPMQNQAFTNVNAMSKELGAPAAGRR